MLKSTFMEERAGLRVEEMRRAELFGELERLVPIIRDNYYPDKIILFGSLASGQIHEWSDIDLAIVKDTDERFIKRSKTLLRLTNPHVGVNYAVYTPHEVEQMVHGENYFMINEIMDKGKVLYERDIQ